MKQFRLTICIFTMATSCAVVAAAATITSVTYSGPANGLWGSASNWSPVVIPANNGGNSYSVTVAANAVVFNIAGSTAINDLALANTLTLDAGCALSASGQMAFSGATITSNGGNFTASGPAATATDLIVNASSGAQVALTAITQIAEDDSFFGTLQASGSGSLLDLSHVTSIAVNTVFSSAQSSTGNEVNLHNLLSVTSTNGNTLGLNLNGGTIDVSNVGGGTSNGGVGSASLSNSGTVLWGSPTNLNSLNLTVMGMGNTIDVSHVATATDLIVNAAGGARLSFPVLTQIAENDSFFGTLQASGSGSLLDLSHVTSIAVNTVFSSAESSTGNEVNLHNLLSVTSTNGNTLGLTANGGTIDVTSLGGGTSNSGVGSVSVSNSGTVLWGSPTNLNSFNLTVTGMGNTIDVSHVATATDLIVNAAGGAHFSFPVLTQIAENDSFFGTMQASGSGSLLDLSHVTSLSANTVFTSVQSSAGNEVNLHNLLSVTSTNGNTLGLTANGGTIDVSSLGGGTTNSGVSSVSLSNSGTILWGHPTNLNLLSLTVTGTGNTIDVSNVATATDLSLNAASGAQLSLPALTQITENAPFGALQASGTSSLLDLSHVTTIAVDNAFLTAQSSAGDEVNLRGLLAVTSSNGHSMELDASGGTIDVSSLRQLTGSIQVGGGGLILLSGSGTISGSLNVTGGSSANTQGTLVFAGAIGTLAFNDSSITGTDLDIGGSAASEPAILDFRLGSEPDHLYLEHGKLVVNPGGGLIMVTPESGITAGTYDLIDFTNGQASDLGGLTLATTSLPGYSLRLQSTATAELLVVTAVPEPSTAVLLIAAAACLATSSARRRGTRRLPRQSKGQ